MEAEQIPDGKRDDDKNINKRELFHYSAPFYDEINNSSESFTNYIVFVIASLYICISVYGSMCVRARARPN